MGKSFKNKYDDWDIEVEYQKEKFRRRRDDKIKKIKEHDTALLPVVDDEEEENAQVLVRQQKF